MLKHTAEVNAAITVAQDPAAAMTKSQAAEVLVRTMDTLAAEVRTLRILVLSANVPGAEHAWTVREGQVGLYCKNCDHSSGSGTQIDEAYCGYYLPETDASD